MRNFLLVALLVALPTTILADCSFTQDEGDQFPHALSQPAFPYDAKNPACPYELGSPVCCNAHQNEVMNNMFTLIDLLFGDSCKACSINLRRMWCGFTCSPDQDKYAHFIRTEMYRDKQIAVLNFTGGVPFICELWESCKRTDYAAQLQVTSALEFLRIQGENAPEYADYKVDCHASESGFSCPLVPCHSINPETNRPYCACNGCEAACSIPSPEDDLKVVPDPPVLEGFNWVVVVLFYGVIFGITAIMTYVRSR